MKKYKLIGIRKMKMDKNNDLKQRFANELYDFLVELTSDVSKHVIIHYPHGGKASISFTEKGNLMLTPLTSKADGE